MTCIHTSSFLFSLFRFLSFSSSLFEFYVFIILIIPLSLLLPLHSFIFCSSFSSFFEFFLYRFTRSDSPPPSILPSLPPFVLLPFPIFLYFRLFRTGRIYFLICFGFVFFHLFPFQCLIITITDNNNPNKHTASLFLILLFFLFCKIDCSPSLSSCSFLTLFYRLKLKHKNNLQKIISSSPLPSSHPVCVRISVTNRNFVHFVFVFFSSLKLN
jgi:hypothetical protein